jgi:hypothetical protein
MRRRRSRPLLIGSIIRLIKMFYLILMYFFYERKTVEHSFLFLICTEFHVFIR